MATETPFGVHSEVGTAAQGDGLRARSGPPAAHPHAIAMTCCSTTSSGSEGQAGPLRLHDQDARARHRGRRNAQPARTDARVPRPRQWLLDRQVIPNVGRPRPGRGNPRLSREPGSAQAGRDPDRRPLDVRISRDYAAQILETGARGGRDHGIPAAAAAEHLFTRDTTCWIYGGVTLNPLYWPAGTRRPCSPRPSTSSTRASPARSRSGGATRT